MTKKILSIFLVLGLLIMISGGVSAWDIDKLEILDVDLNGVDLVIVAPSESIDASVEVNNHNHFWRSTKYQIEGESSKCINVPEPDLWSGINTKNFPIVAPSSEGTYNFEVKVYEEENCYDYEDDYMIIDGIIVVEADGEDPEVTNIQQIPQYPTCSDTVKVCADVTDDSDIDIVELNWNNGVDSASFIMSNTGGDTYCRTLSAATLEAVDGMVVEYSIYAEDEYTNSETSSTYEFTFDCADPTADAGVNQNVDEGDLVTFEGSSSTDSVTPADELIYTWDFGDGSAIESGVNLVNPIHTYTDNEIYIVTLTVEDHVHLTDDDTMTVTVNNVAPNVDAGTDKSVNEGSILTINPTFTDAGSDDTHTATINWGDGTSDDLGSVTSLIIATHTYVNDGVYTVTLTVTDDDGGVGFDTLIVTVNNVAPVVIAPSDISGDEGSLITISQTTFTDAGSDDTHTATINWGDGTSDDLGSVTSPINSQSHTYCDDGTYTVTVTVTDDDGGVGFDTLIVTVNNVAPTFDNLDASEIAVIGDLFSFDVDASDVGCDTLTYSLVDAPSGMSIDSNTGIISWTPSLGQKGTNIITVRASDEDGGSSTAELTITVYDYSIQLYLGWNLISIPLVPENDDVSVENVIEMISSNVVRIWSYAYDESTGQNEWSYYTAESGDLDKIVPGYGYYVLMGADDVLYLNGEKYYGIDYATGIGIPMPPQVELTTGWNLIGHYGLNDVPKENEFQDLSGGILTDLADVTLLGEDAAPKNVLIPTKGYWAFITGQNNLLYAPSEADYSEFD